MIAGGAGGRMEEEEVLPSDYQAGAGNAGLVQSLADAERVVEKASEVRIHSNRTRTRSNRIEYNWSITQSYHLAHKNAAPYKYVHFFTPFAYTAFTSPQNLNILYV